MIFLVLLLPLLLAFFLILSVLYCNFRRRKNYWRDKSVPHKEPRFLVGNFSEAGSKNLGVIFRELYEEGKKDKFLGVWQFTLPVLLVIDLELVKSVLVGDFLHFDDHGVYYDEETDPLAVYGKREPLKKCEGRFDHFRCGDFDIGNKNSCVYYVLPKPNETVHHTLLEKQPEWSTRHERLIFQHVNLLTMGGSAWRNLRSKLNPAFTAGKLKSMFPIILSCGEQFTKVLKTSAEKKEVVEFKDLFARFTTDVISSCAFGIETNSLKDENAVFRAMGKKVFQSSWEVLWRNFVGFLFPEFARFFKIRIYPKHLTEFFVGVIRETMNYRETNNVRRNDILQMLIQLKNQGFIAETESESKQNDSLLHRTKGEKFSYEQAAAQAFIFFTAGFETSSTTMQYALYELAMNPDIQNKVRKEIRQVVIRSGGTLTFDAVHDMAYLGRVLDETLRKYPPATNLSRVCTKDYRIPGTDITLEKGTQVSVSVLGLHWDERYYPQPEKFDPERFTEEERSSRPPYTYMPFGEGPRYCIGQRFGLTQAKVGLISILSNYEVSVSTKTQIPPVYDPKSFFSAPKGGMHLRISLLPDEKEKKL